MASDMQMSSGNLEIALITSSIASLPVDLPFRVNFDFAVAPSTIAAKFLLKKIPSSLVFADFLPHRKYSFICMSPQSAGKVYSLNN